MSPSFVLDASIALTLFLSRGHSPEADPWQQSLGEEGQTVVAGHWSLEVTNVLLGAERGKKRRQADSAQFLALIGKLPVESEPETHIRASPTIVARGRKH